MNKKVYIIGSVIVGLLIIMALLPGDEVVTDDQNVDVLSTSTANVVSSTTPAATSTPKSPTVSVSSTTKVYTMVEVAINKDRKSCWSAISGKVYDLTNAIDLHPGGAEKILGICGKDGSSAFTGQHGGQEKPEAFLATLVIGTLAK